MDYLLKTVLEFYLTGAVILNQKRLNPLFIKLLEPPDKSAGCPRGWLVREFHINIFISLFIRMHDVMIMVRLMIVIGLSFNMLLL